MWSAVIVAWFWLWTVATGKWLHGVTELGLHDCSPWNIKAMTNVDFKRLSGMWYLIGRQDVGDVSLKLWNVQVNITAEQVYEDFTKPRPDWFRYMGGCCILQLNYLGRDKNGTCQGRTFSWHSLPAPNEGNLEHSVKHASGKYSLSQLNIFGTDYNNFVVLGNCQTNEFDPDYRTCLDFNLLLLMRQKPDNFQALYRFNISDTTNSVQKVCKGNVLFEAAGNSEPGCQQNPQEFYAPQFFSI